MTKILYFYPDNPLNLNQGNNARANKLLHYFKSRNIVVDFVGEHKTKYAERENFKQEDIIELEKSKLINKGYLLRERKRSGLIYLFKHSIPKSLSKNSKYFDALGVRQQADFERILKTNTYDYVIISYVLYTKLIANKKLLKGAKLIVDTHDFFTAQFNSKKHYNLGKAFETELKLLAKYDAIWSISNDESFIFTQFLPFKNILTVAHGEKNNFAVANEVKKDIDLFYIASKNPHNVKAAKWFFNKVYPLLPEDYKITVVGRICDEIPDLKNVTKIRFAENIDSYYKSCKMTICPMLTGTGLKIKVVESLSYAKPVVCNERGVDGLLCKMNNGCLVTNDPIEFADYIKKLLGDNDFYENQVAFAKDFFEKTLDEKVVFSNLDTFFKLKKQ